MKRCRARFSYEHFRGSYFTWHTSTCPDAPPHTWRYVGFAIAPGGPMKPTDVAMTAPSGASQSRAKSFAYHFSVPQ